jgi:hypothetical protein
MAQVIFSDNDDYINFFETYRGFAEVFMGDSSKINCKKNGSYVLIFPKRYAGEVMYHIKATERKFVKKVRQKLSYTLIL